MVSDALMTAEELLAYPVPHKRTELVNGRLVVREPAGFEHGRVAARLLVAVATHVHATKTGEVLTAETGFTLHRRPDTVRAPDVAFVSHATLAAHEAAGRTLRGFAELAPDLVVEVLSPDDRPGEVRDKVADWLRAGTRLVWVVDPETRTARMHLPDGIERAIPEDGALEGGEVLPGLLVPLGDVLT
jgi:Uma2 family endonuclease